MKKMLIILTALLGLGLTSYFVSANANTDQLFGCIGGFNC